MTTNADQQPAIAMVTPGELLGRELAVRGWSQSDFASVLGRPTQFVSEIVNGKKEITRDSAAQIGAALSQGPSFWLRLQDDFHLAQQLENPVTQGKLDAVRRRAKLNDKVPVQLLVKRGVLDDSSLDVLEDQVMRLLELESLDEEPRFAAAARRSDGGETMSGLQTAWVACVRSRARQLPPGRKYSIRRFRAWVETLATTLTSPATFADLPTQAATAGVRLVYVEALPGAKIDGCAMVVDGYPVIGLSGRGKRLDKVLFTLLHEAAHVLLDHISDDRVIVEDLDHPPEHESVREGEANSAATSWVFPNGLPTIPGRVNAPWVKQTADRLGVATIVLVGQLQHRGRLDWRTTLARRAPTVDEQLSGWS